VDDDELIAAMAGGDDAGLRELFSRHAPWLAARLRRVLPAAEVEDVLQETFLAVWRGAGAYRPGDPGSAADWVWEIARRHAALGPDREAWRLMYVEDRPVAEVAELTGAPWGTVKSRAHRAGQQLRAALRRRDLVREGGER
jgi:RNA polymerase sigma-70 factor (ECF subfamily)